MSTDNRDVKNKAMSSRMKAEGVKRSTMKCPMCHGIISIGGLYGHLSVCRRADTKTNDKK